MSPTHLFLKMFPMEVIHIIVEESSRYAKQKNDHDFSVTTDEILTFFGILLLSGYNQRKQQRHYWTPQPDIFCDFVASAMQRDKFEQIKRFLHFVDNNNVEENKEDRFHKILPLLDLCNKAWKQFGIFKEKLCIDEQMVPYYRHHTAKQFMTGKPIRFGYKNWMLCSSDGYCFSMQPYSGSNPFPDEAKKKLPLGSMVVFELLEAIDNHENHELFIDNYFTSYDLLKTLKEKNLRCTGTVRENRLKQSKERSVIYQNLREENSDVSLMLTLWFASGKTAAPFVSHPILKLPLP